MIQQGFHRNAIFWVEVDKIQPNPFQPRKDFDDNALQSLADSIKQYGVLQPLVVTRKEEQTEDGGLKVYYELVAGERRLRASKLAGLTQVPVLIRDKEDTDQEKLELAIIENLQREDLNPIDKALAFKQLVDKFGMTHVQIAKKVGKSREYVSNALRLLMLPEDIQRAIANGVISEGHARPLLMLSDKPEEQQTLFKEITMQKLTVRESEHIARSVATDKVRKQNISPEIIKLEKELTESLGTRVRIEHKDGEVGRVHIDFSSKDDLFHLVDLVKHHKEHSLVKSPRALETAEGNADNGLSKINVDNLQPSNGSVASEKLATALGSEFIMEKTTSDNESNKLKAIEQEDKKTDFTEKPKSKDAVTTSTESVVVKDSTPTETQEPVEYKDFPESINAWSHQLKETKKNDIGNQQSIDTAQPVINNDELTAGVNNIPDNTTSNVQERKTGQDEADDLLSFENKISNLLQREQKDAGADAQNNNANIYPTGKQSDVKLAPELENIDSHLQTDISNIMDNPSVTPNAATDVKIDKPEDILAQSSSKIGGEAEMVKQVENLLQNDNSANSEDTSDIGVTFNPYMEEQDTMPGFDGESLTPAQKAALANSSQHENTSFDADPKDIEELNDSDNTDADLYSVKNLT